MSHIIFNVFCVVLVLLVSYLLGCFNGSVVISHFIIKDDVRSHGSGNAGLTNFYRTYGAKYALLVIALDMGKTVVAGLIGGYLFWFLRQDWTLGLLLAGIGCELGHMFPAFYGFKGGKGILCGGTLALCNFAKLIFLDGILPPVAAVVCLTLLCTVILSQLIGGLLPVIAEKLKMDPAVMASPLITTIVDTTTLLVYFNIARTLLKI